MKGTDIPARAADLIWRELEDGTVVVSPEAGMVRALNDVGSLVWSLIDGRNDANFIVAAVQRHYDLDQEQAEQDVGRFLSELEDRQLITWTEHA